MCVISETHHLLRVSEYKLRLAFSPVFTLHLHPFTRQFRSRQKVPGSSEISKAITLDKHNSRWRERKPTYPTAATLQFIYIFMSSGDPYPFAGREAHNDYVHMHKEKEAYNVFIHNHLYRKENGDMYVRLIFYGKGPLSLSSSLLGKQHGMLMSTFKF